MMQSINDISPVILQAGEFFRSAQSRAIEQQREYESRQQSGESMETPLLHDQVDFLAALVEIFAQNIIRNNILFHLNNLCCLFYRKGVVN